MFARTERLLLRPGWREDAPALYEAINDESVVRNLARAPWPYLPSHAEAFLSRDGGRGDVRCLILLRTADAPRLIGCIGLAALPSGAAELGYWLGRPFWGRGYATEAGRAMVDVARDGLRLKRLESGHFVDNPASGRVLRKLGFRPGGGIEQRYSAGRGAEAPCRLFELDLTAAEEDTAAAAMPARALAA